MSTITETVQNKVEHRWVSAKGSIVQVNGALSWLIGPSSVDVLVDSADAPYPKLLQNISWNQVPGDMIHLNLDPPQPGDRVQVGFMNGNPNYPYIRSYFPVSAANKTTKQNAQTPRSKAPSSVLAKAHGQ